MAIMEAAGLTPNRLTNIWVPFVVAATLSLRAGGRMALVLPAELLQVSYAAQLRSFLTDYFARINVVACNELFFDEAEQEVVLLLADEALPDAQGRNQCQVAFNETATVAEVTSRHPNAVLATAEPKIVQHDNEKWLKYFLSAREIAFMRELRRSDVTARLGAHATVDVGVVTGKNEFFVLSTQQVEELGLREFITPLISRSVQLKGTRLGQAEWSTLAAAGDRVHLLHVTADRMNRLTDALRNYIKLGEEKEFHRGYKCSIRNPWYTVPAVWAPDGFVFRQIYDFPRMVLNRSGATSTDTIHRLRSQGASTERVIANTYTWLTAASAEIEGRSYGGGVLELEPTEAERLMMPAKLNGAMALKDADQLIRNGRLSEVLDENARIVLKGHMGLSTLDCQMLHGIWTKMRDRRMSRRRTSRAASAETSAKSN